MCTKAAHVSFACIWVGCERDHNYLGGYWCIFLFLFFVKESLHASNSFCSNVSDNAGKNRLTNLRGRNDKQKWKLSKRCSTRVIISVSFHSWETWEIWKAWKLILTCCVAWDVIILLGRFWYKLPPFKKCMPLNCNIIVNIISWAQKS